MYIGGRPGNSSEPRPHGPRRDRLPLWPRRCSATELRACVAGALQCAPSCVVGPDPLALPVQLLAGAQAQAEAEEPRLFDGRPGLHRDPRLPLGGLVGRAARAAPWRHRPHLVPTTLTTMASESRTGCTSMVSAPHAKSTSAPKASECRFLRRKSSISVSVCHRPSTSSFTYSRTWAWSDQDTRLRFVEPALAGGRRLPRGSGTMASPPSPSVTHHWPGGTRGTSPPGGRCADAAPASPVTRSGGVSAPSSPDTFPGPAPPASLSRSRCA